MGTVVSHMERCIHYIKVGEPWLAKNEIECALDHYQYEHNLGKYSKGGDIDGSESNYVESSNGHGTPDGDTGAD